MDLTPYVDRLRRELAVAAEAGGPDARALAERLTAPLDATARLVLLEALAGAAGEITADLAPGSVEVRLRGRDPDFVVVAPPPDQPAADPAPGYGPPLDAATGRGASAGVAGAQAASAGVAGGHGSSGEVPPEPRSDAEEGGTARITLRVPEHLKPRIENAAGEAGLSVNAWLVRAVAAALDQAQSPARPDPGRPATPTVGAHFRGWVR
ncbi:hypothetical protein [Actinomadura gamaensis]|uniref:Toxin-antitoxin system HicB family antitoxin n=1 Tax=Actinomadura gamaensis TaxID=1763541 RepID=A0ABV9TTA9_9ACTN